MMILIKFLMGAIVLGVLSFGAFYNTIFALRTAIDPTELHAIEAHIQKKDGEYFLSPPFFRLPPLIVPIVKQGEVVAYYFVRMEMEASSLAVFSEAKVSLVKLIDGVFADLYAALGTLWQGAGDPDQSVIKERVQRVADQVMGKGKIKSVYIRDAVVNWV
ncbi:MAG: hypothetical protein NTX76_01315 [Alphaproteobacteria bacterium]|nr:hypothetical protein [Alphaproteobacteria bacterium]